MSRSSSVTELATITRKNSTTNNKTTSLSRQSTKVKIAHRTRSKCPINDRTLNEIEADLPDDLLIDNQNTNDITKLIENNNLNLSDINNSLFTSASTPLSINDPNDDLWFEFLNSLQQPRILEDDSSLNSKENNSLNKLNDNDDATEDPDFTVCLESCDLEEPDYLDDWFQVPRRETIELVKDAIEFCDNVPIVYEDQRVKDKTAAIKVNSDKPAAETTKTYSINNEPILVDPVVETTSNISTDLVLQFTDLQRKQLDEQLRTHVQLLTQTCLVCYSTTQFSHLSSEAKNLLNVLDNLIAKPIETNSDEEQNNTHSLLASTFEIVNLKDSLNLIDDLQKLSIPQWDLQNGFPSKILELIIKSRVFYNTNLLPTSRYKYSSQFTRFSFSDCEKILLILGFNQFKHLPKDECCQCIKEHLLPHRIFNDIKKQLSSISNSEQRQTSLKELFRKQKSISLNYMENFNFINEIHYKSPLEQIDRVQLPSMYTLIIERLNMANILKETRILNMNQKPTKETAKESAEEPTEEPSNESVCISQDQPNQPVTANLKRKYNKKVKKILAERNANISINEASTINEPILIENNIDHSVLTETVCDNDISIIYTSAKRSRTDLSPVRITPVRKTTIEDRSRESLNQSNAPKTQTETQNTTSFIQSLANNSLLNLFGNKQGSQTIIIDNNGRVLTANLSSLVTPYQSVPNFQYFTAPTQQSQVYQQPKQNLVLPNNFNGTILYQPTIHIHTTGKNELDMSKYKKLAPKK